MRAREPGRDLPVRDRENPPGIAGFSCPSEDGVLFGSVYYAEGVANPTILLCHGFPGLDKNCDLAHELRRAGFNVVVFSYRGAWGSRGAFTFVGTVRDVANMTRHILRRKLPLPERFDGATVVPIGFSMGAFSALRAAAALPELRDVGLIGVWNIGLDVEKSRADAALKERLDRLLAGAGCLEGTTRAALWNELLWRPEEFDLRHDALSCGGKRILLLGAAEDEAVPVETHQRPLADLLRRAGAEVSERIVPGDHAFSAQRWEMTRGVLGWLEGLGY